MLPAKPEVDFRASCFYCHQQPSRHCLCVLCVSVMYALLSYCLRLRPYKLSFPVQCFAALRLCVPPVKQNFPLRRPQLGAETDSTILYLLDFSILNTIYRHFASFLVALYVACYLVSCARLVTRRSQTHRWRTTRPRPLACPSCAWLGHLCYTASDQCTVRLEWLSYARLGSGGGGRGCGGCCRRCRRRQWPCCARVLRCRGRWSSRSGRRAHGAFRRTRRRRCTLNGLENALGTRLCGGRDARNGRRLVQQLRMVMLLRWGHWRLWCRCRCGLCVAVSVDGHARCCLCATHGRASRMLGPLGAVLRRADGSRRLRCHLHALALTVLKRVPRLVTAAQPQRRASTDVVCCVSWRIVLAGWLKY